MKDKTQMCSLMTVGFSGRQWDLAGDMMMRTKQRKYENTRESRRQWDLVGDMMTRTTHRKDKMC